jgi:hypothetical protein
VRDRAQAWHCGTPEVDRHGLVAATALLPDLDDANGLRGKSSRACRSHAITARHDRIAPNKPDVAVDCLQRQL